MITPVRLKLSRAKGFNLQAASLALNGLPAVKVTRPTKWGNPFVVGKPGGAFSAMVKDQRHAWQLYRSVAIDNEKLIAAARTELKGKNLACFCHLPTEPYQPDCCHAAVLLEIANAPDFPVCKEVA